MNHDPARARPIAAIDIGSNSVFMMIVQPLPDGSFRQVSRNKVRARLGASVAGSGTFTAAKMDEIAGHLAEFATIAEVWDAEVVATATAAVRRATNGDELLARIAAASGIIPRLLDGGTEAALSFRGARHGGAAAGQPMLCVDVGGGSTELGWGAADAPTTVASAPVGAVTLTRTFLRDENVTMEQLTAARTEIARHVAPLAAEFADLPGHAIATSGSIARIGRIMIARQAEEEPLAGYRVSAQQLHDLAAELAICPDHKARRAIPGMDPDRADVLLAGTLVFAALSEHLAIDSWTISVSGLRTGMIAEVISRRESVSI